MIAYEIERGGLNSDQTVRPILHFHEMCGVSAESFVLKGAVHLSVFVSNILTALTSAFALL